MALVRMGLPYPPFDYVSPGWYAPAVAQALGLASVAVAAFACGARLRSGARDDQLSDSVRAGRRRSA